MRTQMTDQKSGEQGADACTQGDANASDGKGGENADETAEENCQAQHDEIYGCAGSDDGADAGCRLLYDRLRTDDAKHVASLQHDAGCDREFLVAAAQGSQVEATRPILLRGIAKICACKLRVGQQDVGRRERYV